MAHDFTYTDGAEAAVPSGLEVSYSALQVAVGQQFFGKRTGFNGDQTNRIDDCIKDGLRRVYLAHRWNFLHPTYPIVTSEPYEDGTVTVASGVVTFSDSAVPTWAAGGLLLIDGAAHAIDTRDSVSQVTLLDTSLDAAAGTGFVLYRTHYDLPTGFDAIEGDELFYPAGLNDYYPQVKVVKEAGIRRQQQYYHYAGRPVMAALAVSRFDPTVGSVRQIMFFPSPDAVYELYARLRLKPTMLDGTNQYPIGGDTLGQVFIEACLAAGEVLLDDRSGEHTAKFNALLAEAVQRDKLDSTPGYLGKDEGAVEQDDWPPVVRRGGTITLFGEEI
jgi:hypothetical protein